MEIDDLVWDPRVVEKIARKHTITDVEVESVFFDGNPWVRRYQQVYHAFGQTAEGRYLFIVFISLGHKKVRPITARDMTSSERRLYQSHRRSRP